MLAASRGLHQAHHVVTAGATERPAATHWSRSCHARFVLPDARVDPRSFAHALAEILQRHDHAVLLPGGESSLRAISEHRHLFDPLTRTGLPPHERVLESLDKVHLLEAAARVDLAAPPSLVCAGVREAVAAAADLGVPVVVKPVQSYIRRDGRLEQRTASVAHDRQGLEEEASRLGWPVIVQRFEAKASILSCAGVFAGDELLGFTTARYHRTWPPAAGSASFAETVEPPAMLEAQIEAMLRVIGWQGIFEVELLELADGRRAVIDFNPRVFGWLALAVHAGANLPALWVDWLLGRPVVSPRVVFGMSYRWEDAEFRHLLWQLRRGHLRAAAAVLRPHRRVVHAHFAATDPGPLVARVVYDVRRLVPRRS